MARRFLYVSAMSLSMIAGLYGCSNPNDSAQRAGGATTPPPPQQSQPSSPSYGGLGPSPGVFSVQSPGSYMP
jgi:hypothetical protein